MHGRSFNMMRNQTEIISISIFQRLAHYRAHALNVYVFVYPPSHILRCNGSFLNIELFTILRLSFHQTSHEGTMYAHM